MAEARSHGPDGAASAIEQITIVDVAPPGRASDPRLLSVSGDKADTAVLRS